MSQAVVVKFGGAVIWTVNAWLIWDRFVSESSQNGVEATLLWFWYFLLGAASQVTWAATAWLFVAETCEWLALPPEYTDADRKIHKLANYEPPPPDWSGAESLRGFVLSTHEFTTDLRELYPGWTATWSYVYVVQAAAQLAAQPLDAPSSAQTIAVLVLSAASLASVKVS
jgi:hypothetical protein